MEKNYHLEKAKDLVNKYYSFANNQLDAIQMVDNVVLTTLCQKIDSLDGHVNIKGDFDMQEIKDRVSEMKYWQLVAVELQNIKQDMAV